MLKGDIIELPVLKHLELRGGTVSGQLKKAATHI